METGRIRCGAFVGAFSVSFAIVIITNKVPSGRLAEWPTRRPPRAPGHGYMNIKRLLTYFLNALNNPVRADAFLLMTD